MKLLVTGSSGFIGGSLARYASSVGHQVMGTGRSPQSGNELPEYARADVTAANLSEIVRRFAPDVLFHAVGGASVGASLTDPLADLHAAAVTCANVLEGVRRSGMNPLVILPSSAAVYGNPTKLPVNEEGQVKPISPYGFHKAASEMICREYSECFGFDILICRLFSIFGAAQRRLLIWELYEQLAGPNQTVWLGGTGSETRDFLHVDDAAVAILKLAEEEAEAGKAGRFRIVNVGSGIEMSVTQVGQIMQAIVAPRKEIRYRGITRGGDPLRWRADVSLLRSLIPWKPKPVMDGLLECIAAWQGSG